MRLESPDHVMVSCDLRTATDLHVLTAGGPRRRCSAWNSHNAQGRDILSTGFDQAGSRWDIWPGNESPGSKNQVSEGLPGCSGGIHSPATHCTADAAWQ
jgi:hypothetical protein